MYDLDRFYLKEDNNLPIVGRAKAIGGIYEVLKFAENLAIKNGLIDFSRDYS